MINKEYLSLITDWKKKYFYEIETIDQKSPLTLKSYSKDLEQVFYQVEVKNKKELTTFKNIEEFLLFKAKQAQLSWGSLSIASRNRKSATIKAFFKWLYRKNYLISPLFEKIKSPKVPQKIPHFISVDEAIFLIQSSTHNLTTNVLICLLYGGGLRISEACHIKWSDLDFQQRKLLVLGKGNKERVIILPKLCFEILNKLKLVLNSKISQKNYIWGDKPLNQRVAYSMVRKQGALAGLLKPLHPHALRHSYATHLLQSGADLRALQELLGHSTLQATEKYTHLTLDQLSNTINKYHPLKTRI